MSSIIDDLKTTWNRPNNSAIQLILVNVAVFILLFVVRLIFRIAQLPEVADMIGEQFMLQADLQATLFRPWTILTYAFNHAGIFHIFWNMIGLFWFGRLFNEYLGSQRLINLYVIGAVFGGLIYLLVFNAAGIAQKSAMVGASGAIYAIVIATAVYLPNYKFNLLLIGPVKIIYIGLFFILISLLDIERGHNIGGNLAHLGGALIGYIYTRQLKSGHEIGGFVFKVMEFIKSLFVRRPKIKVTHRKEKAKTTAKRSSRKQGASSKKARGSNVSQDEIDAILDKISDRGYESLTKDEKEKLFNASKK
jgi:membrane associated rhomboid family serine protease